MSRRFRGSQRRPSRDASVSPTICEVSTVRRRTVVSLALLFAAVIAPAARAQTRALTGRVYDDATQQGVPGALVSVVNGTGAAQAGPDGRYRIVLPAAPVRLLFRGLGYKRQEIAVDANRTTLDIALAKEA